MRNEKNKQSQKKTSPKNNKRKSGTNIIFEKTIEENSSQNHSNSKSKREERISQDNPNYVRIDFKKAAQNKKDILKRVREKNSNNGKIEKTSTENKIQTLLDTQSQHDFKMEDHTAQIEFALTNATERAMKFMNQKAILIPKDSVLDSISGILGQQRNDGMNYFKKYCMIKKVDRVTIPSNLVRPPSFQPEWFALNTLYQKPFKPKFRYLPNFDVLEFTKRFGNIETFNAYMPGQKIEPQWGLSDENSRAIHGVGYMLRVKTNQSKGLALHQILISICELFEMKLVKNAEYKSAALETLYSMLEKFHELPCLDVSDEMRWNVTQPTTSMLPVIIYTLANLFIQEIADNISYSGAREASLLWLKWAGTSLDQEHLNNQSKITGALKLLYNNAMGMEYVRMSREGKPIDKAKVNFKELFVKIDPKELLSDLSDVSSSLLKYFIQKSDFKNLNEMRKVCMEFRIIANPGNFISTAMPLELEKSIEPRVEAIFNDLNFTEKASSGFPIKHQPDDSRLSKMFQFLMDQMGPIRKRFERNLELEFARRLTNNSSGYSLKKVSGLLFPKELKNISNQRLIQFLMDYQNYSTKEGYMERLSQISSAGTREQTARRMRLIQMIGNPLQALFILPLIMGENVAKGTQDLASGKQVGDLRDMTKQLFATSSGSVTASMDVSGMDASTQTNLVNFVMYSTYRMLDYLETMPYFWAASGEIAVYTDTGEKQVFINSLQNFIQSVTSAIRPIEFKLKDEFFYGVTSISGYAFFTGAFHTAVQHNMVLFSLLNTASIDYRRMTGLQFQELRSVAGDDIFAFFDLKDEQGIQYVEFLLEEMRKLGLKTDPEASKFDGIFLQQRAVLGMVEPLPMRLSMYCSERGEARKKDGFAKTEEIYAIVEEMAGRSVNSEQVYWSIRPIWNILRHTMFRNSTVPDFSINGTSLTKQGERRQLVYSYQTLFLPEFLGHPLTYIISQSGRNIRRQSWLAPRSDLLFYILIQAYKQEHVSYTNGLPKYILEKQKKYGKVFSVNELRAVVNQYVAKTLAKPNEDALYVDGWLTAIAVFKERRSIILEEARQSEFSLGIREKLSSTLNKFKDANKLHASAAGNAKLLEQNIMIPESILFFRSADTQIRQAITKPVETLYERSTTDDTYLTKVKLATKSKKVPDQMVNELTRILLYPDSDAQITSFSTDETYYRDAEHLIFPDEGADMYRAFKLAGLVSGVSYTRNIAISAVESEAFKGINAEELLKVGYELYSKHPDAMEDFFEAVQVSAKTRSEMLKVFKSGNDNYSKIYASILNPRKYFFIATNPNLYAINGIFRTQTYQSPHMRALSIMLLRDYTLAYLPWMSNKMIVSLTPSAIVYS